MTAIFTRLGQAMERRSFLIPPGTPTSPDLYDERRWIGCFKSLKKYILGRESLLVPGGILFAGSDTISFDTDIYLINGNINTNLTNTPGFRKLPSFGRVKLK